MNLLIEKSVMRYVAAGIILIICAIGYALYRSDRTDPPDGTIAVRYSLSVQNATRVPIKDAKISINGPVKSTATQNCRQIEASQAHSVLKDNFGNQSLTFQWDIFPPLATKIITIKSEIQVWGQPQKDPTHTERDYLAPEPLIESEDSRIKMQALKLKGRTPLQTAENICNWVADHIVYKGYISRNRGAVYALNHGQGDCTEYAFLFVALCRANGLPARPMAGFVCPQSMVVDFGSYHNWAEFYLDGRWHIADPQNKRFMSKTPYYIAFQNIRPGQGLNGFLIGKIEGQGLTAKIGPRSD